MIVQVLCEQGLIGLTLVGVAAWYSFKSGWRMWDMYRNDVAMRSCVAILGAICAYEFLLSLKQGSFIASGAPFAWWLVLAKIATREEILAAEADGVDAWENFDLDEAAAYGEPVWREGEIGWDDSGPDDERGLAMPAP
jgi:hypothetical protein